MTTVVAVRTPQHIVIGADTLLTQGDTRLPHTYNLAQKVYTVGHSCIGLSGSVSHYTSLIQALRHMGEHCRLWGEDQVFETFTKVHKKLKDEFFLNPKKQPDDPYEGNHISAMVANGSGIYGVYAHREVIAFDRFWCNGSGRAYALGAMHALWAEAKRGCLQAVLPGKPAGRQPQAGPGGGAGPATTAAVAASPSAAGGPARVRTRIVVVGVAIVAELDLQGRFTFINKNLYPILYPEGAGAGAEPGQPRSVPVEGYLKRWPIRLPPRRRPARLPAAPSSTSRAVPRCAVRSAPSRKRSRAATATRPWKR